MKLFKLALRLLLHLRAKPQKGRQEKLHVKQAFYYSPTGVWLRGIKHIFLLLLEARRAEKTLKILGLFFHIFSLRWFPPSKHVWEKPPALEDAFPCARRTEELCNYWTLIPPPFMRRRRLLFIALFLHFAHERLIMNKKKWLRETKELKALLHNFDCRLSFPWVKRDWNAKREKLLILKRNFFFFCSAPNDRKSKKEERLMWNNENLINSNSSSIAFFCILILRLSGLSSRTS